MTTPEDWWQAASSRGSKSIPASTSLGTARAGDRTGPSPVASHHVERGQEVLSPDAGSGSRRHVAQSGRQSRKIDRESRKSEVECIRRPLAGSACGVRESRTALRELVAIATGVGKSSGDICARDRILSWLRTGRADFAEVFHATGVAGAAASDPAFNARVLSFMHWIMVLGGASALASACESASSLRPSPATRVCLEILRVTHSSQTNSVLESASDRIRAWPLDAGQIDAFESSKSAMSLAVDMYALFLVQKLSLHASFPEVEVNYSIDRYLRKLYIERKGEPGRIRANDARHNVFISRNTAIQVSALAHGACAVANVLDRAKMHHEITGLVFTDACNAYALGRYLMMKTSSAHFTPRDSGGIALSETLEKVREWLARKVRVMTSRGGESSKILSRFVEKSVVGDLEAPEDRLLRHESKNRREVPCLFSSFEGMHNALEANYPL